MIDFILENFKANRWKEAMVWGGKTYSYDWMLRAIRSWSGWLEDRGVMPGTVAALEADFSPNGVTLLFAMIGRTCIVVPLTESVESQKDRFQEIAQVEASIRIGRNDAVSMQRAGRSASHPLYLRLRERGSPGLVLFSSGSTGESKAAVHDFSLLLEKYKVPRHAKRTIAFLLFDHIGGLDTLLYTLSNGGCVITVKDRSPDTVCDAVAKYKAEVLPATPTFIKLLLLSRACERYDMSSLEIATYGSEVMSEATLSRFCKAFPGVRTLQKYGLTEVGILRSKTRSSDSVWVKVGGEGFQTRIVDGMLEIKGRSAMLGYLNASSPFTEDGWLRTGDLVEEREGDLIRILGRKSEIINVGGAKVYPAEVEAVLQEIEGVEEVTVSGESNPITGAIVKARVKLNTGEALSEFRKRMRGYCSNKLPGYMIPQKVILEERKMHGERFKKMRNWNSSRLI